MSSTIRGLGYTDARTRTLDSLSGRRRDEECLYKDQTNYRDVKVIPEYLSRCPMRIVGIGVGPIHRNLGVDLKLSVGTLDGDWLYSGRVDSPTNEYRTRSLYRVSGRGRLCVGPVDTSVH